MSGVLRGLKKRGDCMVKVILEKLDGSLTLLELVNKLRAWDESYHGVVFDGDELAVVISDE